MRKRKIKKIVKITVSMLLVFGAVFALVGAFKNDTRSISSLKYTVGGIGDNGEYVKDDQSIYTKDMFECYGLTVEPTFEFDGTYKIFFYNMDKDFLSATAELSTIYNDAIPAAARYARIMITPQIPEDKDESTYKIGAIEKLSVARDVAVTVSKDQKLNNIATEGAKNKSYVINDNALEVQDDKGKAITSDIIINTENVSVYRIVNDSDSEFTVYFRNGSTAETVVVASGDTVDVNLAELDVVPEFMNIVYSVYSKIPKVYAVK